jgi:glycosyltransferase involved in cell wall biosynthesis
MKIAACCRTYNETLHVKKFCEAYQDIADIIVIADGGSTDDTVPIALTMPKTIVKEYNVKVECKNGILRNPDGPHIQFLVDSAIELGADWIIFQDCDMRPNKHLKENGRQVFIDAENLGKDFIMITQVFLWENTQFFPNMSLFGDHWAQGLWAWRAGVGMKIIDKMPHFEFSYDGTKSIDFDNVNGKDYRVQPPFAYLHFGWEDMIKATEHADYYRKSGLIPGMAHPLSIGGKLQPITEWMVE